MYKLLHSCGVTFYCPILTQNFYQVKVVGGWGVGEIVGNEKGQNCSFSFFHRIKIGFNHTS